jgi:hypothetical protein
LPRFHCLPMRRVLNPSPFIQLCRRSNRRLLLRSILLVRSTLRYTTSALAPKIQRQSVAVPVAREEKQTPTIFRLESGPAAGDWCARLGYINQDHHWARLAARHDSPRHHRGHFHYGDRRPTSNATRLNVRTLSRRPDRLERRNDEDDQSVRRSDRRTPKPSRIISPGITVADLSRNCKQSLVPGCRFSKLPRRTTCPLDVSPIKCRRC